MNITIEDSRERARVTEHHIENTAYTKYPGNYYGELDVWILDEFESSFKATIVDYKKGRDLEIDLKGIGAAIANAYRRIMIAEVPTVAIEHCFIYNNTSVIQDEMLAHRLGLIPLRVDPCLFKWKPDNLAPSEVSSDYSVVFSLKAKCERFPKIDPDKTGRREDLYKNHKVYTSHMVWEPIKRQRDLFCDDMEIRPVHRRILIAKLSGNQEIDLKLHAQKGMGRDHAKFSPVATASYRLMPDISVVGKITGEAAVRLQESFSEGVVELDGVEKLARVANPRLDSGSRNVFRHQDLKDKVRYDLIKDHFIFRIESTGSMKALDILLQASLILESKCEYFLEELRASRSTINEPSPMVESV